MNTDEDGYVVQPRFLWIRPVTQHYAWIGQKATDQEEDDAIAFYIAGREERGSTARPTPATCVDSARRATPFRPVFLDSPSGPRWNVIFPLIFAAAFGMGAWAAIVVFFRWLAGA